MRGEFSDDGAVRWPFQEFLKLNHRLFILVRKRERERRVGLLIEAPTHRNCVWSGRSCDLRLRFGKARGYGRFDLSFLCILI